MIVTVFLWITLVVSIITLVALASPLRLSVNLSFRRPSAVTCRFLCCYIHPSVWKYEYPSTKPPEAKRDGDINDTGDDAGQADIKSEDDGDGVETDTAQVQPDTSEKPNERRTGVDTDIDDRRVDSDGADAGINTGDKNDIADGEGQKKAPLSSRIKARVNKIKRNRVYKLLSNRALRDRLLKWLWRTAARSIRFIPFERFKLRAVVGYRDPAALGKLYGYFTAAQSALELRNRSVDMSLEPVFTEERLEIDCELAFRTTVSVVLWELFVVLVTFPYLGVYRVVKPKKIKSKDKFKIKIRGGKSPPRSSP